MYNETESISEVSGVFFLYQEIACFPIFPIFTKKSIMPTSTIKARLPYDATTVWNIITSSNDHHWRSDIARIEKLSDNKFMEYTRSGYATLFTITTFLPFERYEFDLENENIKGHWCGSFSDRNGQTEIKFTEIISAKKWYLKPFVKIYLRKQQSVYIKDLRQKLLETVR